MKNINKIILSALAFAPVLSFAAATGALSGLQDMVNTVGGIVKSIVPIVFGLAVIYLFYTIGKFILHADDPKVRDEGKQQILWAVIAMFVIISIYGIVVFIGDAVGIKQTGPIGDTPPTFTTQ